MENLKNQVYCKVVWRDEWVQ